MVRLLRFALAVLAVLTLTATGALAAPSGNNQGNAGKGEANGKSQDESNSSNGSSDQDENKKGGASLALPATDPEAEAIQPAVQSNTAIPLEAVLDALAQVSPGRMLEIRLTRRNGALVYDVTVLEGHVARHVLIEAKSGRSLETKR